MKAPDFAYVRARDVAHAIELLSEYGDEAAILAGGQSLMAMLNLRVAQTQVLVDINRIDALGGIHEEGDTLRIGALTRYAALERSALVEEHLPLIAAALPHVAHDAIRNRGTVGGSIALADPAAEIPACCLALDARVTLAGPGGERVVAMDDWFTGLYDTARAPDEIVTSIQVPKRVPDSVSRFAEFTRRHGDFAIVGIAVSARIAAGVIRQPRIALLGVSDRPVLAGSLMAAIDGIAPGAVDAELVSTTLSDDVAPLEDPAYPPEYRAHAIAVLARRTLAELASP